MLIWKRYQKYQLHRIRFCFCFSRAQNLFIKFISATFVDPPWWFVLIYVEFTSSSFTWLTNTVNELGLKNKQRSPNLSSSIYATPGQFAITITKLEVIKELLRYQTPMKPNTNVGRKKLENQEYKQKAKLVQSVVGQCRVEPFHRQKRNQLEKRTLVRLINPHPFLLWTVLLWSVRLLLF